MRNSRFRGTLCSKNHELDFYNFSSVGFALQMSRGTSTADFKYIKLVYFAKYKKKFLWYALSLSTVKALEWVVCAGTPELKARVWSGSLDPIDSIGQSLSISSGRILPC